MNQSPDSQPTGTKRVIAGPYVFAVSKTKLWIKTEYEWWEIRNKMIHCLAFELSARAAREPTPLPLFARAPTHTTKVPATAAAGEQP